MDGDFDYSRLSRAQLEEALTRIDKARYPVNHQRILRELEFRPPDPPARPEHSSSLSLAAWYAAALVSITMFTWLVLALTVAFTGSPDLTASPLVHSVVDIAVPLFLFLRLARNHLRQFWRAAMGLALVGSALSAIVSYVFGAATMPRATTVLVASLSLNVVIGSLVGTLQGMRHPKPRSDNRGVLMPQESSRGLLIAILIVSIASLAASFTQLGITLRGVVPRAAAAASLPARYSEHELSRIAASITDPYNRGDVDGIYATLDDVAKNQTPRERVVAAVEKLKGMLGNIDSAKYEGFRELPHDDALPVYQLNYSVKLSGHDLPSGTMQIRVIDRPSGPSILGFTVTAQ